MKPIIVYVCLGISIINSGFIVFYSSRLLKNKDGYYLSQEVTATKIINCQKPILNTYTIIEKLDFSGNQISPQFVDTIRGAGFIGEDMRKNKVVIYHSGIQSNQLKKGDKILAWFQFLDTTLAGENYPFCTPLEIIKVDFAKHD